MPCGQVREITELFSSAFGICAVANAQNYREDPGVQGKTSINDMVPTLTVRRREALFRDAKTWLWSVVFLPHPVAFESGSTQN